jgi:hypothetical protein
MSVLSLSKRPAISEMVAGMARSYIRLTLLPDTLDSFCIAARAQRG